MKNKWLVILMLIVFAIGIGFYMFLKKQDKPIPVRIIRVFMSDIVSSINAIGQVEAIQESAVSTKTTGIIDAIFVKEGMRVEAGQVLLNISSDTGLVSVKSPMSGQVVFLPKKNIVGKYVNIGESLLTVADIKHLRVEANINEIDMGLIQKGQKAIIKSDAFRNKTFSGEVYYIAPEVREVDGISKVLIYISLDRQNELIPGSKVSVQIITSNKANVKSVPIEAVIDNNNKKYLLLDRQGFSFLQEIKIGVSNINNMEIISDDVKDGDKVILDYQTIGLHNGVKVEEFSNGR